MLRLPPAPATHCTWIGPVGAIQAGFPGMPWPKSLSRSPQALPSRFDQMPLNGGGNVGVDRRCPRRHRRRAHRARLRPGGRRDRQRLAVLRNVKADVEAVGSADGAQRDEQIDGDRRPEGAAGRIDPARQVAPAVQSDGADAAVVGGAVSAAARNKTRIGGKRRRIVTGSDEYCAGTQHCRQPPTRGAGPRSGRNDSCSGCDFRRSVRVVAYGML